MTQSTLRVLAGATAFEHVQQYGLRQQDIDLVVGASGGPKWFCLFGLDQYLFGEFFKDRTSALSLVGSSAGAWRFACVTQHNPAAATERFAKAYSSYVFQPMPVLMKLRPLQLRFWIRCFRVMMLLCRY